MHKAPRKLPHNFRVYQFVLLYEDMNIDRTSRVEVDVAPAPALPFPPHHHPYK